MTEDLAALIDDDYEQSALDDTSKAVVAFTDDFLAASGPPAPELQAALVSSLGEPGVVELALGLALFHGFSKMLIALGLEPEAMDTVVLATPDTA